MTPFGEYLKMLRERAGLSQESLAEEADISSAYISQLETGRRNPPTPDVLRRMAPALGVPYTVLLQAAGHLTETELHGLLLRAIRVIFAEGPGRIALESLLREAVDRWLALDDAGRRQVLEASDAEHVGHILLDGLLQQQTHLLFAEIFPQDEGGPQ